MSDRDYSPLSAACVRALSDKLYDKRKAAALEIEKMVKDFIISSKPDQIAKLIRVLEEFAMSHNPHTRKGGLIGLAAVAIGLGTKNIAPFIRELVSPILACFTDSNPNVRYYATESLYNVVRVSRGTVLSQFNDIFTILVRLATDADQNVKNGSEMLDRIMKDIVTESNSFDMISFIPVLREKLYANNHWAQTLVVSWVSVLHTVPEVDTLSFLSDILEGLFFIMEGPKPEVKKMCEAVVGEFLASIKKAPEKVKFADMINIVITHAQSNDPVVQMISLTWIHEFVRLSGRVMLPHLAGILTAILPCLALDDPTYAKTRGLAKEVNINLMRLITVEDDRDTPDGAAGDDQYLPQVPHTPQMSIVPGTSASSPLTASSANVLPTEPPEDVHEGELKLGSVMEVLHIQLRNTPVPCKTAVLRWIYHLHNKIPNKMFRYLEELFPVLLRTLSDPSDEVVLLVIEVLAQIASTTNHSPVAGPVAEPITSASTSPGVSSASSAPQGGDETKTNVNEYFTRFLQNLLHLFTTERNLLEDRGPLIIRQLCVMLSAEDIYRTLAELLQDGDDLIFASKMVQTLSSILLTSKELFLLRRQLKDLSSPESCELFVKLYRSWSHNPVATLTLCLLTQNYTHAATLVHVFGDIEVTADFLVEVDKLVQLLESPIFTYLRLQLLDPKRHSALVEALYGLLMLLPQTKAFTLLHDRLNCLPPAHLLQDTCSRELPRDLSRNIDFEELLAYFNNIQEKHRAYKHQKIKQQLQSNVDPVTHP
ncbi:protein VAC14 homolog isoform X2 [Eriocheir sinensis]|uniref:protein VAC14 homolog isoform X2 n=1 Tax=Eriocheir sinensis TaxID=95602 RepID=UPI0021CA4A48|nr:protein VAC14 homolog isoform X2 [Eriocheir sinensis]